MLLFAAQFTSCEKYVLPDLSFTPDTLWFSAQADSQRVELTTNVITTAEPEDNVYWLYADPQWTDESTTVFIHVQQNLTTRQRSAQIIFKSESLQHNLMVFQEAGPEED